MCGLVMGCSGTDDVPTRRVCYARRVPEEQSSIERVVEAVRAALHARRSAVSERLGQIRELVDTYERALELEIAQRFAAEHGLKQPARSGPTAADAARALHHAVTSLPELVTDANPPSSAATIAVAAKPEPSPRAEESRSDPAPPTSRLAELLATRKLVVLGALSGRDRAGALPPELAARADIVDTERDGVSAIGNLPKRIRQGRVAAVIILDRVILHKHSEPVIAAARDSGVPVGFAGQGGRASLLRALTQIEETLASRAG